MRLFRDVLISCVVAVSVDASVGDIATVRTVLQIKTILNNLEPRVISKRPGAIAQFIFRSIPDRSGEEKVWTDAARKNFQMTDEFMKRDPDVIVVGAKECGEERGKEILSSLHLSVDRETCFGAYVLKYVNNCRSKKSCESVTKCPIIDLDPLGFEFAINRVIFEKFGAGITPKILFISELFRPGWRSIDGKDSIESKRNNYREKNFSVERETVDEIKSCRAAAEARVIVEKRAGIIVGDLKIPDESLLKIATKIFIACLKLLEQIHSIGIAHGDIHLNNIAFTDYKKSANVLINSMVHSGANFLPELVLIDFGRASIDSDSVDAIKFRTGPVNFLSSAGWTLLSPGQLSSGISRRSDDCYRLFEAYLFMLTQNRFNRLLNGALMTTNPKKVLEWIKLNFDFISKFGFENFENYFNQIEATRSSRDSSAVGLSDFAMHEGASKVSDPFMKILEEYEGVGAIVGGLVENNLKRIQEIARSDSPSIPSMISLAHQILENL